MSGLPRPDVRIPEGITLPERLAIALGVYQAEAEKFRRCKDEETCAERVARHPDAAIVAAMKAGEKTPKPITQGEADAHLEAARNLRRTQQAATSAAAREVEEAFTVARPEVRPVVVAEAHRLAERVNESREAIVRDLRALDDALSALYSLDYRAAVAQGGETFGRRVVAMREATRPRSYFGALAPTAQQIADAVAVLQAATEAWPIEERTADYLAAAAPSAGLAVDPFENSRDENEDGF